MAVGLGALESNPTGARNVAAGNDAMASNTTGRFNTVIGDAAGGNSSTGERNTLVGRLADLGSGDLTNATALGANAQVDVPNALVLGSINGVNGATSDVNVGIGTTTPGARLDIATQAGGSDIRLTTADGNPDIVTRASEGTLAAPVASGNSAVLFTLRGQGYNGTNFEYGALIAARTTQAWNATANGTRLEFAHDGEQSPTPRRTRVIIARRPGAHQHRRPGRSAARSPAHVRVWQLRAQQRRHADRRHVRGRTRASSATSTP